MKCKFEYCDKELEGSNQKSFCSRSHSAKYWNARRVSNIEERICLNCGNGHTNRKFCSSKCQQGYQSMVYIEAWLGGDEDGTKGRVQKTVSNHVRNYLLNLTDNKCSYCSWGETNPHTGTIPLEVDHIDGDYLNNRPSNLRVLCPNCHALTSTHRGANVGKRKEKRPGGNRGDYWKDR